MLVKTSFNADKVVDFLQTYLSDLNMVYSHLHNFHWNVEGAHFFEYHEHLQDMYTATATRIDDVAERILQLGARPITNLVEYADRSSLQALPSVAVGVPQITEFVLADLNHLVESLRRGIELAQETTPVDEGTADFLVELLREVEKDRWFWSAISG